MAIAKLSIDIEAKLAGLQQSLDKAGALAEGQAKRIEGAFANVGKGINTALGAIGAVYLTKQIVAFTLAQKDAILAIKDLSEATGASYEKISGLEQVAMRAGGSLDDVNGVLIKFNAALRDAGTNKDVANVFKGLNLDVAKLKQLDPAQALVETAKALSTFADDGNRSRYELTLFSKKISEAGPLMRELAEAGDLQGKVTDKQVLAADRLNKELALLSTNATAVARDISVALTPALNRFFAEVKAGVGAFGGIGAAFKNLALEAPNESTVERLKHYRDALKEIREEQQRVAAATGTDPFNSKSSRMGALEAQARDANKFIRYYETLLSTEGAGMGRGGDPRGFGTKQSLSDIFGGNDAAAKKAAADRLTLAEFSAQQLVALEEITAQETVEAWSYVNKKVKEQYKDRTDAAKTQWQQVFDFIDAEQEREIQAGQDYLDAINASTQDAKKAGEEIGLVFASAAGQALTQWQGVRKLFQGVLADLAQIAVKKSVTEPLSGLLGNALGGFNWTSLFAGRASGGPVSAGTPYMVGESGPELFLPRSSGTIVPNGAVGGVTVHQVVNIGSGVSRNEVMAAMQATKQQTIAAIVDARTRGYALGPA